MKRSFFAAALAAGLLFATTAMPVTAAPKELKLFLRWDDDGAGGCGPTYLSPEDDVDGGNSCAFIFQVAQEAFAASGQEVLTHQWPGVLAKPVKLMAGKVTGEFTVKAYAAAQATLEVALSATTKKGTVEIGTFTSDAFNTAAAQSVPITFELDVPKALVKKKIESISLSTTFRGVSVQSYIELDSPAAFLTFPVK